MRVSKTVKEYIEKKVAEAYNCHEAQDAAKQIMERADKVVGIIENEIEDLVRERLPALKKEYEIPEDLEMNATLNRYRSPAVSYNRMNCNAAIEARAESRRNREAREKALENIIVTLELGGTRADLDRMLSELSCD